MKNIFKFALVFIAIESKAQCVPELLSIPNPTINHCIIVPNSDQYWASPFWWDENNQLHDLPEGEIDINLNFIDTCPNNTTVRCLLYLDLNNDGLQETVIDSDNPPAAGLVDVGNALGTGVMQFFDNRLLPSQEKWKFGLETVKSANNTTVSLRWTSAATPGIYFLPELPYGNHKVLWELRWSQNGLTRLEYNLNIADCAAPAVACINHLEVNITPGLQQEFAVNDLLLNASDNATQTPYIKFGLRASGAGTDFPIDVFGNPINTLTYNCPDLGVHQIELWAIDLYGNMSSCQSTITILDSLQFCQKYVWLETCTQLPGQFGANGITFQLQVQLDSSSTVEEFVINSFEFEYCGKLGSAPVPLNSTVTVTASEHSNANWGFTQSDLVVFIKHLNGSKPFTSPYQWFAADVNRDGECDSTDLNICRSSYLGIEPIVSHWRVMDKNAVITWPGNPLANFQGDTVVLNIDDLSPDLIEFISIPYCEFTSFALVGFEEPLSENAHFIGNPQPNPTSGETAIPIQLSGAEDVVFELYDAAGKIAFTQFLVLQPGKTIYTFPEHVISMPGMYFWRVQAGNTNKSGKLLKR